MLDTIRFFMQLPPEQIAKVKTFLSDHLIISNDTGAATHQFTTGYLLGSFDYRIKVFVKDSRFESVPQPDQFIREGRLVIPQTGLKKTLKVSCPDYLDIELSIAKFSDNVNFLNCSPEQDLIRVLALRNFLSDMFGFQVPTIDQWEIRRADLGRVYTCLNNQASAEYIESLKSLHYPRRRKKIFENGIFFPGSTTTFKIYNKHLEFKAHDLKRLRHIYATQEFRHRKIESMTEGLVRVETELHKRFLDSRELFSVADLFNLHFNEILDKEIKSVLGGAMVAKTMIQQDVKSCLQDAKDRGQFEHEGITVDTAVCIWSSIVLYDKKKTEKAYGRQKVYRAIKVFNKFGIPLSGALEEVRQEQTRNIINLDKYRPVSCDLTRQYYLVANL